MVSFIRKEHLPKRLNSYPEVPPDLAIEVVSPSDKETENEIKIAEYQKYGIRLVWLVLPFSRRIDVIGWQPASNQKFLSVLMKLAVKMYYPVLN